MGAVRPTGAGWAPGILLLFSLILSGCGLQGPTGPGFDTSSPSSPPPQARPLVILFRLEPPSVATRPLVSTGSNKSQVRIFNAMPALRDARGLPRPELLA